MPAAPPFQPGDLVRLTWGGPVMRVLNLTEPDREFGQSAVCEWFSRDDVYQERSFQVHRLVRAEPDAPRTPQ